MSEDKLTVFAGYVREMYGKSMKMIIPTKLFKPLSVYIQRFKSQSPELHYDIKIYTIFLKLYRLLATFNSRPRLQAIILREFYS